MAYNFPKPNELPKPSIDQLKIKMKLRIIAQEVEDANIAGNNTAVVDIRSGLNHLEIAIVYDTIKNKGYHIDYYGGFHGIYWE